MLDIANTLLELEALAIRMAVKRGDNRWEAEIVARFHELSKRQMFAADGTLDTEWEARNVAFHESLYAACGSPSLKLVCHVLYERHSRYRRLRTKDTGKPGRDVSKEHETLMRATMARDASAAVAQLRKHRSRSETCWRTGRCETARANRERHRESPGQAGARRVPPLPSL